MTSETQPTCQVFRPAETYRGKQSYGEMIYASGAVFRGCWENGQRDAEQREAAAECATPQ